MRAIPLGYLNFSSFIRFIVGDGASVFFREDYWLGDSPLCCLFPSFYHSSLLYPMRLFLFSLEIPYRSTMVSVVHCQIMGLQMFLCSCSCWLVLFTLGPELAIFVFGLLAHPRISLIALIFLFFVGRPSSMVLCSPYFGRFESSRRTYALFLCNLSTCNHVNCDKNQWSNLIIAYIRLHHHE